MHRLISATVLIAMSTPILADLSYSKYQKGDCITPISETYSRYGKYAIVEAYSAIEGFTQDKSYVLAFPFSGSRSTIFSKAIEPATKKVKSELCGI